MHDNSHLQDVLTDEDFQLFQEWLRRPTKALLHPRRGEIVEGTIVQISPTEILVDIGAKRDGFVPSRDVDLLPEDVRASLHVGMRVPVIVRRVYEDTEDIELSLSQAYQEQDWVQAHHLQESKEIVECRVLTYNKGGLIIQFGQLRGFVPLSHLANVPKHLTPEERLQYLSTFVGQTLPVVILEVDRARRRLIASHREAVHILRERRKDELLATLKEGDVVEGVVRNITHFGAFVDLNGVDGLIHRSELAWERVNNVADVVQPGQTVKALVIKVDREQRRIGLSLKRLQPNPWEERVRKYRVGDIVPATITNVTDFGAFARLEEGLEGLIHRSELPLQKGQKPQDLLQRGDQVMVRILHIDPQRQRISLGMRGVPQWEETEESPADSSPTPDETPTA